MGFLAVATGVLANHLEPPGSQWSKCPAIAAGARFLQTTEGVRDWLPGQGRGRVPIAVLPPPMEQAAPGVDLFLARVERASERVLILDFDAAVAPVAFRKRTARAMPEIVRILDAAMPAEVRVAVVGKGSVSRLEEALSGMRQRPELWGRDGRERLTPDGNYFEFRAPSPARGGVLRSRFHRRLVVRRLLREAGDGAALALLGGTRNEHGFAELFGRGLSGLIASRRRASCADIWIGSRAGLLAFLRRWTRAVQSGARFALRQTG